MTVTDPIPTTDYGKGNWQDYVSNWRQKDAGWVQERSILRYADNAARAGEWGSPKAGQVTYNDKTKTLELYRGTGTPAADTLPTGWVRSLMFQNLTSVKDDATGVNISHTGAAGKGATFGPTSLLLDLPMTVMNGVLAVDANTVGVQTPAQRKAVLSTNATELVSDTPLAAPGLRITGTGTLDATGKAMTVGALTATSATIPNITMTGTMTGGVLNGTSGTIGGVTLASNNVQTAAGSSSANAAGFQAGQGYFYGDGNSAVMRQRTSVGSAAGAAYVQAQANSVALGASGQIVFWGQTAFMSANQVRWYDNANVHRGYCGPVFYGGVDPASYGAQDGSIWFQ